MCILNEGFRNGTFGASQWQHQERQHVRCEGGKVAEKGQQEMGTNHILRVKIKNEKDCLLTVNVVTTFTAEACW